MFGRQSILTKMASLVRVRDVCSPILTTFNPWTTISEASLAWEIQCQERTPSDPMQYVSLVAQDKSVVGWLDFSDLHGDNTDGTVEEVMSRIHVSRLVSCETSLIDAARLFSPDSPYGYLVLEGNELTGFFSYHDLISAPFQSCLFSLLLSVEDLILQVLDTNASLALTKLNKGAVQSVTNRLQKRAGKSKRPPRPSEILKSTLFGQKVAMLTACGKTANAISALGTKGTKSKRLIDVTQRKVKIQKTDFLRLDQMKGLRNALAHPSSLFELLNLLSKDDLCDFMTWLCELEDQLGKLVQNGTILSD